MQNEEIQEWLKGQQDYARGRELFEKYSRKKSLINLFRRKYKPEVLRYNLEKIGGKEIRQEVPVIKPPKPAEKKRLVITDGRIRLEDLPDHIQPLYREIRELYPRMRALHEKMKVIQSETERAKYRKELAELDDKVSYNWQQLDSWYDSKEKKE